MVYVWCIWVVILVTEHFMHSWNSRYALKMKETSAYNSSGVLLIALRSLGLQIEVSTGFKWLQGACAEKCIQSYSRSNPLWRCIPTNRGRDTFIPRVYSFVRLVVNLTGPFLHPLRNSWKQLVRDQYSLHTGKSKSALNVCSNNKLIKPIALVMWNYTVGNGK